VRGKTGLFFCITIDFYACVSLLYAVIYAVWDEIHFNNHLLGPVPEEGVSRLVTQQVSERRDHFVRYGLAFMCVLLLCLHVFDSVYLYMEKNTD
jgi:hypothetical protein